MRALKDTCYSFIHGRDSSPATDSLHPNLYPGTNEVINQIAYACKSEISQAVESSHKAFRQWSQMPLNQRSAILLNAANILRQKVNELAVLEVWDTGKPITEALSVDVLSAADCS